MAGQRQEDVRRRTRHALSEAEARTRHALSEAEARTRHALRDARGHLSKRPLKLVAFLVGALLVFQLVPGLQKAFDSLKAVSWQWVAAAVIIEALSESGFVVAWRGVVDPDKLLEQEGRGRRMPTRLAWAQLGGGMVIPGGSFGSLGVGAWMLHRLGMPNDQIAERQFLLMFLNTAVDGLAIIVFGLGLAVGVFSGEGDLLLTLVPALVVVVVFALAVFGAGRSAAYAERVQGAEAQGRQGTLVRGRGREGHPPGAPRPRKRRRSCSARSPTCCSTCSCCGGPSSRSTPTPSPASASSRWRT